MSNPNSGQYNAVLCKSLEDMGFDRVKVAEAVNSCQGDPAASLDLLLYWKEEEEEALGSDDSEDVAYAAVGITTAQPDDIIDESPLRSNLDSPPAYSNGVTPYDAPPPFTGGTMLPFVNAPAPPAATAATAGGAAAAGTIIYSKIPDVSKLAPVNYEQFPADLSDTVRNDGVQKKLSRRDLVRQESLQQLYKIVERDDSIRTDQAEQNGLANQIRGLLYDENGKPRPATRRNAPKPIRIPRPKTANWRSLDTSSPMHCIHFAMLQSSTGVPVSINVFNNKKYSKSFIGKEAETWIRANVRGCDPAKAIEILKKLVRGRFVLQIDYKEALRPYDSLEIYRLNPKSKLIVKPIDKQFLPKAASDSSTNPSPQTTSSPASRRASAPVAAHSTFPNIQAEFESFLQYEWYHQRISKTVAEQRVGTEKGNFLIRESSRPECLCITYVSATRGVSHVLVEKIDGAWTMKGAPQSWKTVPDLLHSYRKVYSNVIPPPKRPQLQRNPANKHFK